MNYDVVRSSISTAYKNYGVSRKNFDYSMDTFYEEGAKNPSVAKIMLNDYIFNNRRKAAELLNAVSSFPAADISACMSPESLVLQERLYTPAVGIAIKSINAEDIYKQTSVCDEKETGPILREKPREKFNQEWNKLYPKTGEIRNRIINANRVTMDKVTPKAGWFEKINFTKTLGEYKQDYPKTFYARYSLVMNNQIEEGHVTSRVKGWFSRFSYKRLIKEGFCFKKG